MKRWPIFLLSLFSGLLVSGCAVNPVTGEQELSFVSTGQELAIGQKNYGPYRQAEGGDYVLDPALTAYVREIGQRLAAVSDRKLPYEFNIINDSTPNAWALPGGKVAINRGLLVELDSEAELAAVLGHEIVHAAARHSAQGMQRGVLMQGAMVAASMALGDSGYSDLAMTGAQLGATLTDQKYGRDAERESDYYGMRYMVKAGYDPAAAVELQETFVRLSEGNSPDWIGGLFASHPPSQERVNNNIATARELGGQQGTLGRERYQRMIAGLKRSKPAYKAYDEARKALEDGNTAKARALVEKAIRIEPRESLFHGLYGDVLAQNNDKKSALKAYDRAVVLNPDYYMHYLTRGFTRRAVGATSGARVDLERSLRLLPTAEGNYGLGQLALAAGDRQQAVAYLRTAASSNSPVGKAAQRDLAKLTGGGEEKQYLSLAIGLDANGYLLVAVKNRAAVAVRGVRVVVGRRSAGGIRADTDIRLRSALRPGEQRVVRSNLGPMNEATARTYGAVVAEAQLVK